MPYDEVEVTRSRVKPMNKQVGFLEDGQMLRVEKKIVEVFLMNLLIFIPKTSNK